jgi:hypothetical protein
MVRMSGARYVKHINPLLPAMQLAQVLLNLVGSVRKDKITGHADIRTHTGMRHMLCQVEADKKKQAQQVGTSAAALRGKLGKHLTFTQKDVIIDRLFTIVYALAKKHIAMNAMSDICDMVRACDAVIGNDLMTICSLGPTIAEFNKDLPAILQLWHAQSKKGRYMSSKFKDIDNV